MPDGGSSLTLRAVDSVDSVASADWDACAGEGNPFVGHAFLHALEDSESVGREAGWLPTHLVAEDETRRVVGCVPLYFKNHSYGEYVFDHGWAQAFERAGGRYYPKLQCAVPFTPVPGPRLLVRPGADVAAVERALAQGLVEVARQYRVSSLHVTFCDEPQAARLEDAGFVRREGTQFHWHNQGYRTFDDFLARLSSRKRKQMRRERREALGHGIEIARLSGAELTPAVWDTFFRFYISTSDRKWGSPYLTRGFFDRLGATLGERVVLVMARKDGEWIAGALNVRGGEALYGRNWGCRGDWPFLHFECCYYQAIDHAIAHGLARIEAGAQGPHKLQRGYVPSTTYSAHWIADPGFRKAVADFCAREKRAVEAERRELEGLSPYRLDGEAEDARA